MNEVAEIHQFATKLQQTSVRSDVGAYVACLEENHPVSFRKLFANEALSCGPLSINLDLTVACNYACPHCIDESILNTRLKFTLDEVRSTLTTLRLMGLRSVILIGGGEPTVHPDFARIVRVIKALGLHCGIVSNGGRPEQLVAAAGCLGSGDWIRLSLDAGSDEVFQRIHRPRNGVHLEEVSETASRVKNANPDVEFGFSFIVITPEALHFDARLTPNHHEMVAATRLARRHHYDYISFKPYLARDAEGKEVLPYRLPSASDASEPNAYTSETIAAIQDGLHEAQREAGPSLRVIPSVNLLAMLESEALAAARRQPPRCHMQALRQVVTPHGVYGCPAYRGDARSRITAKDGYLSITSFTETAAKTRAQLDAFNASHECRNITCLYNAANWWLDDVASGRAAASQQQGTEKERAIFL